MPKIILLATLLVALSGCLALSPHGRVVASLTTSNVCWSVPNEPKHTCNKDKAVDQLWLCAAQLDGDRVAGNRFVARQQVIACMQKTGWEYLELV